MELLRPINLLLIAFGLGLSISSARAAKRALEPHQPRMVECVNKDLGVGILTFGTTSYDDLSPRTQEYLKSLPLFVSQSVPVKAGYSIPNKKELSRPFTGFHTYGRSGGRYGVVVDNGFYGIVFREPNSSPESERRLNHQALHAEALRGLLQADAARLPAGTRVVGISYATTPQEDSPYRYPNYWLSYGTSLRAPGELELPAFSTEHRPLPATLDDIPEKFLAEIRQHYPKEFNISESQLNDLIATSRRLAERSIFIVATPETFYLTQRNGTEEDKRVPISIRHQIIDRVVQPHSVLPRAVPRPVSDQELALLASHQMSILGGVIGVISHGPQEPMPSEYLTANEPGGVNLLGGTPTVRMEISRYLVPPRPGARPEERVRGHRMLQMLAAVAIAHHVQEMVAFVPPASAVAFEKAYGFRADAEARKAPWGQPLIVLRVSPQELLEWTLAQEPSE